MNINVKDSASITISTNGDDICIVIDANGFKKRNNTYQLVDNHLRYEHPYVEILFDNRGDAETVLQGLKDIGYTYGFASVADLYDIAGWKQSVYTDNKFGWFEERLYKAHIMRVRNGYVIDLPRPLPID